MRWIDIIIIDIFIIRQVSKEHIIEKFSLSDIDSFRVLIGIHGF